MTNNLSRKDFLSQIFVKSAPPICCLMLIRRLYALDANKRKAAKERGEK